MKKTRKPARGEVRRTESGLSKKDEARTYRALAVVRLNAAFVISEFVRLGNEWLAQQDAKRKAAAKRRRKRKAKALSEQGVLEGVRRIVVKSNKRRQREKLSFEAGRTKRRPGIIDYRTAVRNVI